MDIEKYISSGILEAYALGDLRQEERIEVEKMLSMYPEIRAELALVEETLEAMAFHSAVAPKEGLKERALQKAFKEGDASHSASTSPREGKEGKVLPIGSPTKEKTKKESGSYKYYLAAAITLAVISTFAAFYFFNKWQNTEDQLYVVMAERTAIAQNFKTVENRLDSVRRELAIHTDENFNEIQLQGLALAPDARATVLWNKQTHEIFLNPSGLPSPPTDKQYQLWAIVDGQPVDLGVFAANRNGGLHKMQEIENAAAFAITLEPSGGSPSPTLEQMVVMGETS